MPDRLLRDGWRTVRPWGPPGNERLTGTTGLFRLGLLAVETVTTLDLRSYLPVRIFLGLLLIPLSCSSSPAPAGDEGPAD